MITQFRRGVLFTISLWLCWAAAGVAQQSTIQFQHITQDQGLSQSTGNDILQDHQGFMWFATNDGLNRYDGNEMTVYKTDPSDSTTLSENAVSVLFEDSDNVLWVGTNGGGLNRYNRDQDNFTRYSVNEGNHDQSISDNIITDILEGDDGRLWIGTYSGLNWYKKEEDKFYSPDHLSDSTNANPWRNSRITELEKGNNGYIWVGTENGLNQWNPVKGEFNRFMHDPDNPASISGNHILSIEVDSQGTLWVGTLTGGLNSFNAEDSTFHHYVHDPSDPYSISGNSVFSLLEDSQGTLWVGSENNGINKFDRKEERFYRYQSEVSNPYSISNNSTHSIYESSDQILWVGTFSGGINYVDLKPPDFEHYYYSPYYPDQLSHNSVRSFLEDSHGNFWIGTDGGGLNRFDREKQTFRVKKHKVGDPNTPASNKILALEEDRDNNLWLGYYNGGASKYNLRTGQYTHYQHQERDSTSLISNNIFVVHEDARGTIWFGANSNGLSALNPQKGTFRHYLPAHAIRAINETKEGTLWIGTYGNGLVYLDPATGESESFSTVNSEMPANVVLTIHETNDGTLWLGTRSGLVRFNPDTWNFAAYTLDDGMMSDVIKGIVEDADGNLWLSSNNGISEFNPQKETFTNYGTEDGLQGQEFNSLAHYRDSEGYIYFGGINGFNRFYPDNITIEKKVAPVKITAFQIFNRPVPVGRNSPLKKQISEASRIELPYDASVITFGFTALNFNPVNNNNFAYKLEGFDQDWNYVGTKRTATYTNLDAGEYTFKVRADNSDNVWGTPTELALVMNPPFWQTYTFYVIVGTFTLVFLVGLYQWKVLDIRRRNEQLEETVEKRTAELHRRNSKLKKALQELKETRSELVEKAHKAGMADIATGVLHNVGNILNSVNTSTSVTGDLLKKSRLNGLFKANKLLKENKDHLAEFLTEDPKGQQVVDYYLKLDARLKKELQMLKDHNNRLKEKVRLINDVIASQQKYANTSSDNEKVTLAEVTDYALTFYATSFQRHSIELVKNFEVNRSFKIQKTKLVHILVNILKNAKESILEANSEEKCITIRSYIEDEELHLAISDTGDGIEQPNISKVFNHGFTTKQQGHGFGLHSCANYMAELGGKIKARSKGKGQGATFILIFPSSLLLDDSQELVEATIDQ